MEKINLRLLFLCTSLMLSFLTGPLKAQPAGTTNFYSSIKNYNLTALWRADRLRLISLKESEPFPEPYGALGKNYQRFYIHYTSITKDPANPYRYQVQGKTRTGSLIHPFTGTITLTQAGIYKKGSPYAPDSYKGYKRGQYIAKAEFKETGQDGSIISGTITTDFCINAQNQLLYDTLDFGIDGYQNNQFTGTIKKSNSGTAQILRWGDYNLNNTPLSDAGGLVIPPEYEKYGWQSFVNAMPMDGRPASKAAAAEEKRQWWK